MTGMVYAIKCVGERFAIAELINVSIENDEVLGIEIDYKYQPNGSRSF